MGKRQRMNTGIRLAFMLAVGTMLNLSAFAAATNTPPTLTAFAAAVDTTTANTEMELTFAELAAQGNEADTDGTVEAFVVQTVSSGPLGVGTLKIGASAGVAMAFAAGSNDTIDATRKGYWTPELDVTGNSIAAFTVKAKDNRAALSDMPVPVPVNVTVAPPSSGDLIQGVTATARSVFVDGTGPSNLVNNLGMSDAEAVHTVTYSRDPNKPTHWNSWHNSYGVSGGWLGGHWVSGSWINSELVIFTFPSAQDIAEFAVWNCNVENGFGVKELTISTSVSTSGDADWVQRGETWTFAPASGSPTYEGQGFELSGLWLGVRRVKFEISSNYGGGRVGLSTVRFYRPAAVHKTPAVNAL